MKKSERVILGMVEDGRLSIDSDGRVWRHFEWVNYIIGYRNLKKPVRAEIVNGKYYELHFKTKGNDYRVKAHRIVWMFFNGKVPASRPFTNHKNGNGYDNRPDNLEMVTSKENINHAYRTGLAHGRPGEKHHNVRLTDKKVNKIRREYASGGVSQEQLAIKYGVRSSQISRIVRYVRWKSGVDESDKIIPSGLRGDNKSGYTGVRQDKRSGKWLAHIRLNNKKYYLGGYVNKDDAIQARREAEHNLYMVAGESD